MKRSKFTEEQIISILREQEAGAKLRDRRASLVLLQNGDDLFVCETIALHSLVLSMAQSLLQNGLFQRGKLTW